MKAIYLQNKLLFFAFLASVFALPRVSFLPYYFCAQQIVQPHPIPLSFFLQKKAPDKSMLALPWGLVIVFCMKTAYSMGLSFG
ncbi:MAG: hypothetical protein IJF71_07995, partial [Clostridia bacterium]|nr:hypothetical protein [Clostridia bacterium]